MKYISVFITFLVLIFSPSLSFGEKASDKASTIGQIIPPGIMMYFAGCRDKTVGPSSGSCNSSDSLKEKVPEGWILAYGQSVSRSTYPKLFASIGTTYGIGDGSTTFNLPDCRGRDLAGRDNMGGTQSNQITISGQDGRGSPVTNFGIVIGGHGGISSTSQTSATENQSYTFPKHYHGFTLGTDSSGSHTHSVTINANAGSHLHDVTRDTCGVSGSEPFHLMGTQCTSNMENTTITSGMHGHESNTINVPISGTHNHTITGSIGAQLPQGVNGDADTIQTSSGHFHTTVGPVIQPSIVMNCIIKY